MSENVTYLYLEVMTMPHVLGVLPLIGHLTALQICHTKSVMDDELLAVIGVNCPSLQIFDGRDCNTATASDLGLGYLAQCKKLRHVLFPDFADEYDICEEQLGCTGKIFKGTITHMQQGPYLYHLSCQ
ncbi:unnamed protein product [Meganyctiphanes norvegica]|uniref:Uncharacterized protein n=1 Tax=Meganyctiphanes norvegica TaxID=48144 RepID=A0AAV2RA45_MEGNR